eukprot:30179-Pelagococcus_subviridis.AAC.5
MAKPTSKKPAKKSLKGGKKGGKKSKTETYKIYIYKVLKQVHPDTGISSKAMSIMNSFINDIFEKIATEASKLARYNKKPTVTSREIQTAVRLILPGELAKHAVSEGTKANSLPLDASELGGIQRRTEKNNIFQFPPRLNFDRRDARVAQAHINTRSCAIDRARRRPPPRSIVPSRETDESQTARQDVEAPVSPTPSPPSRTSSRCVPFALKTLRTRPSRDYSLPRSRPRPRARPRRRRARPIPPPPGARKTRSRLPPRHLRIAPWGFESRDGGKITSPGAEPSSRGFKNTTSSACASSSHSGASLVANAARVRLRDGHSISSALLHELSDGYSVLTSAAGSRRDVVARSHVRASALAPPGPTRSAGCRSNACTRRGTTRNGRLDVNSTSSARASASGAPKRRIPHSWLYLAVRMQSQSARRSLASPRPSAFAAAKILCDSNATTTSPSAALKTSRGFPDTRACTVHILLRRWRKYLAGGGDADAGDASGFSDVDAAASPPPPPPPLASPRPSGVKTVYSNAS